MTEVASPVPVYSIPTMFILSPKQKYTARRSHAHLFVATLVALFALVMSFAQSANATTLPNGFTETEIARGLLSPVAMTFAPDGRIFVTEQTGMLRVIKNGVLLAEPFLDLTERVDAYGERGLHSIEFDPQFGTNRYVYVHYTARSPVSHNRVSRFVVSNANADRADVNSETVLLDLNLLGDSTFHNGGAIKFGSDGKLYIATGENAVAANSQSLANLLGKILRINSDGSVPTDNPFYQTATGENRLIWALGLRNPFTFAFQDGTGKMFINDVGQSAWEEINEGRAGANYGWAETEGYTTDPRFRSPVFAYQHLVGATQGCAITGGAFYNPAVTQFPGEYLGAYFFADYCGGWIKRLDPTTKTVTSFAADIDSPVDLKVSREGDLYYLARGAGSVVRVRYGNDAPLADTYLSDLAWTSQTNGYGPVETDQSNGEEYANDGRMIVLNGTPYRKGLGAHANSEVRYRLAGAYTNFSTDVGIDDEAADDGSVVFEVWADGAKLFDSGRMTGTSATKQVRVSVAGKQELILIVRDAGDGIYHDHADWAGAFLTAAPVIPPTITAQPASQTANAGASVMFSVAASGTATLRYQWQRNGVNISGANASSYTLSPATSADNAAQFRAVVSNTAGSATSNAATLTVLPNDAPIATITAPLTGSLYRAGETISYAGTATDTEDGVIPASRFTWRVDFHHDTHTHPLLAPTSGARSGTFTVPNVGETSANVWYRIYLTVTDSVGVSHTTYRDVLPRTANIYINTTPAGLQVTLDGQPVSAPLAVRSVVGMRRTLVAVSPQVLNGKSYEFVSWSSVGALRNDSQTHSIATPDFDTNYTATFREGVAPASFQFSLANYTANEESGEATITVQRTGNTSASATVEYATVDANLLVRCDVAGGTASPRCDYTTAVGRLQFAANETSKTFTVILTNDGYAEAAETLSVELRDPSNAVLGAQRTTSLRINDVDTATTQNPINSNDFFVRQHYYDFLGRQPAPVEVNAWMSKLNACAAGDIRCDRIKVSAGFFQSAEFQQKGFFAYRFYKVSLGRMPTYAEFIPDMTRLKGTQAADKDEFTRYWMTRPDFRQIYDGLTNQAFVEELQRRAGMTFANPAQTVADLNGNQKTRAQVLRETLESNQIYQKEFNEAWVVLSYFGYLRRDGAASEYAAWKRVIDQRPDDYRQMIGGFLESMEYRLRFGKP